MAIGPDGELGRPSWHSCSTRSRNSRFTRSSPTPPMPMRPPPRFFGVAGSRGWDQLQNLNPFSTVGREPRAPNKAASCHSCQPSCDNNPPSLHPRPRERRSHSLVGVHAFERSPVDDLVSRFVSAMSNRQAVSAPLRLVSQTSADFSSALARGGSPSSDARGGSVTLPDIERPFLTGHRTLVQFGTRLRATESICSPRSR